MFTFEQLKQRLAYSAGEHWVTIGAKSGDDGKNHGGTPVQIDGAGKIEKGPSSLEGTPIDKLKEKMSENKETPKTFSELAKINGGVESVYGGKHNFHDKVIVPLHNKNTVVPLQKFAAKYPKEFARMQRAMRFSLWKDLRINDNFLDWEKNGIVTVYRGYDPNHQSAEGLSWSLNKKTAQGFAEYGNRLGWRIGNEKNSNGIVKEKKISVNQIDLYSNAQGEEEIIIGALNNVV